jgi:hypothetical protein
MIEDEGAIVAKIDLGEFAPARRRLVASFIFAGTLSENRLALFRYPA